jgi:hypothetical protein
MFATKRVSICVVVLWALLASQAISAVSSLKAGIYSIRSLSDKSSCEDTYLSYTTTGRTKMQSADAKRPSTWLIMPESGVRGVYSVSPSSSRLSSSKLSYRRSCASRSVNLGSKGLRSWQMKYVYREGGKSGFTITTARKADGPGCRELLGCRSSDRTPTLVAKGSTSTRWQVKLVKPLPTPAFYLGTNGVTVLCPEANVGDTGVVGGVPYTKRDRADLDALVAADPTDEIALTTSCTTGVTDMSQLFGSSAGSGTGAKVSDPATFNPNLSTWDTSSVTTMSAMFAVRVPPNPHVVSASPVPSLRYRLSLPAAIRPPLYCRICFPTTSPWVSGIQARWWT